MIPVVDPVVWSVVGPVPKFGSPLDPLSQSKNAESSPTLVHPQKSDSNSHSAKIKKY